MYKKLHAIVVLSLCTLGMTAQTIVSTTAENRKVVLEEFTGIYCGFCPDGHAIAQAIKDANPDNVFLVNIHQGGFASPTGADPDFRTPWGDAIANQTGLLGYPAGTVNRQNFPGLEMGDAGTTAMGRGDWAEAANITLAENSYVNLAVEATVDIPTNSMEIHVEGYYTGNSPEPSNFLNVAILQNNTLGPQSGGNQGNNYNHQHRLIDLATGQWGEEITTTTQTTFVDRTYNYTFPPSINGIAIDYNELDVVVYMTESTQNIISGNQTTPVVNPLTSNDDTALLGLNEIVSACGPSEVTPVANILNSGLNAITSVDFTYSVNGGTTQTYTWTGNLASLESATVELPAIAYTAQTVNTVDVSLDNDDFNANNTTSGSFDDIIDSAGTVILTITTDQYADEVSWELLNSTGTVLFSESLTASDNNQTLEFEYDLPLDCITFNIVDSYGDGILGGGGVSLIDFEGVEIFPFSGNYSSGATEPFYSNGVLGVNDTTLNTVSVYPNPASDILTVTNAEGSNIEIFNMLGQQLNLQNNISAQEDLNVSNLTTGAYFIKITNGTAITTKKFLVAK